MAMQPPSFADFFSHWPSHSKLKAYAELARDMGVPDDRARKWLQRGWIHPVYWPRFIDVLDTKFERTVTYRQLVEATIADRGNKNVAGAIQSAETRRRRREASGDQRAEAT